MIHYEYLLTKSLNDIFENGGSPCDAKSAFARCMERVVGVPFRPWESYCRGPELDSDEYVADKTIYEMASEGTHTVEEIVQAAKDATTEDGPCYKNGPAWVNVVERLDHWINHGAIHVSHDGIVRGER